MDTLNERKLALEVKYYTKVLAETVKFYQKNSVTKDEMIEVLIEQAENFKRRILSL